jgi:drug/metabolite transporter (DMT)-like permease
VFALGLVSALVASALFNVGIALQALEARRTPRSLSLRLTLIAVLLRRKVWLLGLLLGLVGIAPQVLALATAPFVVVQPALAVGLLLLLAIGARSLAEPVGRAEYAGVLAIIAGVALVSVGAPEHVETHRGGVVVIAVVCALLVPAVLPLPLRDTRFDTSLLTLVACGAGFAAANVATKLMSDDVGLRHWPNGAAWAAAALVGGIAATITQMTAFQRLRATLVVPTTTAIQTFLPVVAEPLFLRERWASPLRDGVPIAFGLAIALVGSVLLARSQAVTGLVAQTQPSPHAPRR